MYYQVFRGDGSSKKYKILSEMLLDFDRMDVEQLFRLVKERYSSSAPEGFDLMLWGDLHTLFEPDEDDEIWKDQHEYNLLSWRLHDFCGIHILLMNNGLAIHMLTEKKYPLSQEMLSKMLSTRLEGACVFTDKWSLDELAYGVPTDGPYQTNPPSPDDSIFELIEKVKSVASVMSKKLIESSELLNESYVFYNHVMNPFTAQQEQKTRKDRGTRRGHHSTSSSSAFNQSSSSYFNDDDDDGNDEGTSRASTPSPTRFVN
ncbi:hypothetical protein Tco_0832030 [Tanacetum coccineum]